MRIAIKSLSPVYDENPRGISVYTTNLVKNLQEFPGIWVEEFSQLKDIKEKPDLVHYPFFDFFRPSLHFFNSFPTVVTIHDVIPLIFSEHYPKGIRGGAALIYQKLALKKVEAVITDSNYSRSDVNRYLGVSMDKIFSVHLAPSEEFRQIKDQELLKKIKFKYTLPDNFALYYGDVNWNKNLVGIATACEEAKINLVLVGGGFKTDTNLNHPELLSFREFTRKIKNNSLFKVLGYIPADELVGIVNLASVCLFTSFYEGFGLPILEAQACNTPIITSNLSSMPEIAGQGAILVDPKNIKQIIHFLQRIVSDKSFREKVIKEGKDNVKKFSWKKTVEETVEVYKYAINN